MAKTTLLDTIIPQNTERSVTLLTRERCGLIAAGICLHRPEFDALAGGRGQSVVMPFWKPLSGARQVLSDTEALVVNKVSQGKDVAWIHEDANAFSANALVQMITGDDPIAVVEQQWADYWASETQTMVLASLKGVFAAPTMAESRLPIAAERIADQGPSTRLTGQTFVDATQLLGDGAEILTAVVMHSAVEASLRKQDLIETIMPSHGAPVLKYLQGRRVFVDDRMPNRPGTTDGRVYTTYLLGQGAFAFGQAPLDTPLQGGHGTVGIEFDRDSLASDTIIVYRRRIILHPCGVAFSGNDLPTPSPTNEDLAFPDRWSRVWEAKRIPLVMIEHNI